MAAFNANQTTGFFENAPQMGLTNVQRTRLAAEGLRTVDDFEDFKPEQIDHAVKNLRTAVPGVPGMAAILNANGNVDEARNSIAEIESIPMNTCNSMSLFFAHATPMLQVHIHFFIMILIIKLEINIYFLTVPNLGTFQFNGQVCRRQ